MGKVGFYNQLRTLLWKNYTLKKRAKLLTALELLVPLVLFVVLVILRSRVPVVPQAEGFYPAYPLLSAGLVPYAQNFCPHRLRGPDGYMRQTTSILDLLLASVEAFDGFVTRMMIGDPLSSASSQNDDRETFISDAQLVQEAWNTLAMEASQMEEQKLLKVIDEMQAVRYRINQASRKYRAKANRKLVRPLDSGIPEQCDQYLGVVDEEQSSNDTLLSLERLLTAWLDVEDVICEEHQSGPYNPVAPPTQRTIFPEAINSSPLPVGDGETIDIEGLITRTLNNNPRIYYAPAGPGTDALIQEMMRPFEQLNYLTRWSHAWLNGTKPMLPDIPEFPFPLPNFTNPLDDDVTHTTTPPPGSRFDDLREIFSEVFFDNFNFLACRWLVIMPMEIDFLALAVPFDSEEELVQEYNNKSSDTQMLAGLVFEVSPNSTLPNYLRYKIRQVGLVSQTTRDKQAQWWAPGPDPTGKIYYWNAFVVLQDMVERAFINLMTGLRVAEPGIYVEDIPRPCYRQDPYQFLMEHMFPLSLMMSWVFIVALLVRNIVYEKEIKLREVMKLMGLQSSVHWLSWFITALAQMSVTSFIICVILKLGSVLSYASFVLLFCVFEIYNLNAIMFAFLISVIFNRSKVATACAGIFYILTYVPYMYISIMETGGEEQPVIAKLLASMLAPTGIGLSSRFFTHFEQTGAGMSWHNIDENPFNRERFNLALATLMMSVSTVIYAVLVWYLDKVMPGDYGIPLPFYFPVTKSYWMGATVGHVHVTASTYIKSPEGEMLDSRLFEEEPTGADPSVHIFNLSKVYSNGFKAVDNLNLRLYQGQILAFLGHNGAGKTTTMSMLTGILPPTTGSATVLGLDLREHMDTIRHNMGMCPQHNVLFEELSVEEHLTFYARLKGTERSMLEMEIETMLNDTGLRDKRNAPSSSLSGGMKRKLSIGIAFISGSQVVILDEPTAGVDPYSRRDIWDLISNCKKGRTIMMSTHHLDEADILGDRIAIISSGKLQCSGSSLFLKAAFGEGYHLTMAKQMYKIPAGGKIPPDVSVVEAENAEEIVESDAGLVLSRFSIPKVDMFIKSFVSSAYLKKDTPREIHYILPHHEIRSGTCNALFQHLDKRKKQLNISSYGITDTSLEEVFLKVTQHRQNDETSDFSSLLSPDVLPARRATHCRSFNSKNDSESRHFTKRQSSMTSLGKRNKRRAELLTRSKSHSPEAVNMDPDPTQDVPDDLEAPGSTSDSTDEKLKMTSGRRLYCQQMMSCVVKRALYTYRNWPSLITQVLLPVLFVSIALLVAKVGGPEVMDDPSLQVDSSVFMDMPTMLGDHFVPVSNVNFDNESYFATPAELMDTLLLPSGLGGACVFQDTVDTGNDTHTGYYTQQCRDLTPGEERREYAEGNDPVYPSNDTDPSPYFRFCPCHTDRRGLTCSSGEGRPMPPGFDVITKDRIQNVTGQDLEQYLYFTSDSYKMSRYMALSFGHIRRNIPTWLTVLPIYNMFVPRVAKAWFDSHGWHSMPASINAMNNAILRANIPPGNNTDHPATYGISVINHPMEGGRSLNAAGSVIKGSELVIAIFVVAGFAFIPAGFAVFLVYERSSKSKHLQFISGLNPLVYWLSSILTDLLVYLAPAVACAVIFKIFSVEAFSDAPNFYAVVCLILAYGWASIPMVYPATWIFDEPSAAYIFIASFNIFVGVSLLFVTFVLDMFTADQAITDINDTLKFVFQIFPSYSLGRGLMELVLLQVQIDIQELLAINIKELPGPFGFKVAGSHIYTMLSLGVIFFIITILIEYNLFFSQNIFRGDSLPKTLDPEEDYDVHMERKRIHDGSNNARQDSMITLENLTKIYRDSKLEKHVAVDKLCLAIPKGECFGLLGINGAGKTTTFKMLTGDLRPSGGNAYIDGKSVLTDLAAVHKVIGYCPQFDALFEDLTAREHLHYYCKLRGIPEHLVHDLIEASLERLNLQKYADKPAGTYSGGNKRKLSTAIALLGDPPVIFLDEPTAGMDPYAKRFLWDLILELVENGKSIILTSHSMEECETLCTRLSVMVSGRLRCLGSVQHLKSRFGNGYSIRITVQQPANNDTNANCENEETMQDNLVATIRFMNANFPEAVLKEYHYNLLEYEFDPAIYQLGFVFANMEMACETLPVTDYSVSQNTLDNVFISFVREHNESLAHRGRSAKHSSTPLGGISAGGQRGQLDALNLTELGRLAALPPQPLAHPSSYRQRYSSVSSASQQYSPSTNLFDIDEVTAQELGTKIAIDTPL